MLCRCFQRCRAEGTPYRLSRCQTTPNITVVNSLTVHPEISAKCLLLEAVYREARDLFL